jgi:hypothetical protein
MIDPRKGPLGQYAIAGSQVQTPGWKPLEGPDTPFEQLTGGGGGGGFGFSLGGGSNEDLLDSYGYEGEWSPMQNNVPPSLRGVYGTRPNADVAYDAARKNFEAGHYATMDESLQATVNLMNKIPQYSIAENQRLVDASQKMMGQKYGTTAASGAAYAEKLKTQQKNKSLLAASRNAWDHSKPPKANSWGPWAGSATKSFTPKVTKVAAPLNPRTGRTYSSTRPHW